MFVFFGLRNVVLAYPFTQASYPVLVHRYRLLQSRFLHSCRRRQQACGLLWVRDVTLPPGRLPLSESWHTCCSFRFLFVFLSFSQTVQQGCAACTCRVHTCGHIILRFKRLRNSFGPLAIFVSVDTNVDIQSPTFHSLEDWQ